MWDAIEMKHVHNHLTHSLTHSTSRYGSAGHESPNPNTKAQAMRHLHNHITDLSKIERNRGKLFLAENKIRWIS
jgi:hypothetical protein